MAQAIPYNTRISVMCCKIKSFTRCSDVNNRCLHIEDEHLEVLVGIPADCECLILNCPKLKMTSSVFADVTNLKALHILSGCFIDLSVGDTAINLVSIKDVGRLILPTDYIEMYKSLTLDTIHYIEFASDDINYTPKQSRIEVIEVNRCRFQNDILSMVSMSGTPNLKVITFNNTNLIDLTINSIPKARRINIIDNSRLESLTLNGDSVGALTVGGNDFLTEIKMLLREVSFLDISTSKRLARLYNNCDIIYVKLGDKIPSFTNRLGAVIIPYKKNLVKRLLSRIRYNYGINVFIGNIISMPHTVQLSEYGKPNIMYSK